MKAGYLSDYFDGVGAKKLTLVEVDPEASNQHEFQGIHRLKQILGTPKEKVRLDSTYIRLADDEDPEVIDSFATWSDVRRDNPDRSPEYHMYYAAEAGPLVYKCKPDDLLVVAKRHDGTLAIILAQSGSTHEKQLRWLFGLSEDLDRLDVHEVENGVDRELKFAARFILDELGIDVETADDDWLDLILSRFGEKFPATSVFSDFARETLPEVNPKEDPDHTLLSWIEQEEMLFRTLERHIVSKRLDMGFEDVDDFISYSLSVQNRRKSRVGHALEHHIERVLVEHDIRYSRGAETENRSKPDFIFPEITSYHDVDVPLSCLTMLGVKSTCKDRWRQVLSEAKRIEEKHLFTLEPGISENQTDEMKANSLTLVLPEELHLSFSEAQQGELLSLESFLVLLKERQSDCH